MTTKRVILFDVDETLVESGCQISVDMADVIKKISNNNYELGIVGGGSLEKILWQMGDYSNLFTYIFAECGAVKYINGVVVEKRDMMDPEKPWCNRNTLNNIIRQALISIANMDIIYHGNQIDVRNGLVYISPPGMQATMMERNYFLMQDKTLFLRDKLISDLKSMDPENQFEIVKGGRVGVAVYPHGWDKSQVVEYFSDDVEIYYLGDQTYPGGNDHSIFSHPRVNGISVKNYKDTISKLIEFMT